MRQLLPDYVDDIDPSVVYADLPVPTDRPAVRLNMISSIDGATAVAGRSGVLGAPADKTVFAVLRSVADVVLVAAGTARAERYGPASVPIAIVSRSCRLDWDTPFFTASVIRPTVFTVAAAPGDNVSRTSEVADVVVAGETDVDLRRALDVLGERGAKQVLAEGGPSLNGQLVVAGLLDELCLTISPKLVSGASKRIVDGPVLAAPHELELRTVCEQDGYLFLRLRPGTLFT